MPSFLRKRLQVFVSSTYTDLLEERQAAVEAILTAGHIPAGMELFTAGDESQMDVIKQWIDQSDVYLLILGGRYGSLEPNTGQSYIELEYRYALDQQKPMFACVMNEAALDERVKRRGREVLEEGQPQKLAAFRDFVLTKVVRFWDDSKDIKIAVAEKLAELGRREDLVGWVPADQAANMPAISEELARLSKENAELRDRLEEQDREDRILGLTYDEWVEELMTRDLIEALGIIRRKSRRGTEYAKLAAEMKQALREYGLVEFDPQATSFSLTEAGQSLCNRLALDLEETE